MEGKRILVIGGGVGGLVVANELRRKTSRVHKIVLVEKNARHAFAPSFLWLMTGDRRSDQISVPVAGLLRKGIELVQGEATAIDVAKREVSTTTGPIDFDYLIMALGADLAPEVIPGLAEGAHSFYSIEETERLQQALRKFRSGRVAVVVSSLPYKCPGAPHEAAMLIANLFRRRGLGDKVAVDLYTPEPQPMPVAGPQLGEAVKLMLSSKGIGFYPQHKLALVNPRRQELQFEGKAPVHYDMLVAIPPHRAPVIAKESGMSNEAGWIPVDRSTLQTKVEGVYAIGDVTSIPIPGRWKPEVPLMLPKAGVFAHAQAEVVAQRIADEINGTTPNAEFCGPGYCMLEAGEGEAGFAFGNFFAEPSPQLELRNVGKAWHIGKVLFERWWLAPLGIHKSLLHLSLVSGARVLRIPIKV
jgi:sulfide:quinone oxidoreductase